MTEDGASKGATEGRCACAYVRKVCAGVAADVGARRRDVAASLPVAGAVTFGSPKQLLRRLHRIHNLTQMTYAPTLPSRYNVVRLFLVALGCCGLAASLTAQRTAADRSGVHPEAYDYLLEDDLKLHVGPFYDAALPAEARTYAPSPAVMRTKVSVSGQVYIPFVAYGEASAVPVMPSTPKAQHRSILEALRNALPASKVTDKFTTASAHAVGHTARPTTAREYPYEGAPDTAAIVNREGATSGVPR